MASRAYSWQNENWLRSFHFCTEQAMNTLSLQELPCKFIACLSWPDIRFDSPAPACEWSMARQCNDGLHSIATLWNPLIEHKLVLKIVCTFNRITFAKSVAWMSTDGILLWQAITNPITGFHYYISYGSCFLPLQWCLFCGSTLLDGLLW